MVMEMVPCGGHDGGRPVLVHLDHYLCCQFDVHGDENGGDDNFSGDEICGNDV